MINLLIKQIKELGPLESEKLQYFGSSIPTLDQEGLPQRLNDIEIKLGLFRSRYTDDDPLIIRLEQDKESIAKLLKSSAIRDVRESQSTLIEIIENIDDQIETCNYFASGTGKSENEFK